MKSFERDFKKIVKKYPVIKNELKKIVAKELKVKNMYYSSCTNYSKNYIKEVLDGTIKEKINIHFALETDDPQDLDTLEPSLYFRYRTVSLAYSYRKEFLLNINGVVVKIICSVYHSLFGNTVYDYRHVCYIDRFASSAVIRPTKLFDKIYKAKDFMIKFKDISKSYYYKGYSIDYSQLPQGFNDLMLFL